MFPKPFYVKKSIAYGPVIFILSAATENVVRSGPVMQAGPPEARLGFLGSFTYAEA